MPRKPRQAAKRREKKGLDNTHVCPCQADDKTKVEDTTDVPEEAVEELSPGSASESDDSSHPVSLYDSIESTPIPKGYKQRAPPPPLGCKQYIFRYGCDGSESESE